MGPSPSVSRPKIAILSRLPATFRSLRYRNYRLWFFGNGLSLVGTWMQLVGQQVLVYRLTGSATALGMVNFIAVVPMVPLALWGGSLTDRINKRRLLLMTQAMMMLQALVLAILAWTGLVQVWHVFLLALLHGAFSALDLPARQAFTVDLVEDKEDLTNAIGLNSVVFNLARVLGPALAGVAVGITGEGTAFFLNALSFLAVISALLAMRDLPKSSARLAEGASAAGHMQEGVRFVVSHKSILVIMSLLAVSAFLSMPYMILMPVFASDVLMDSADPVIQWLCGGAIPLLQCQIPEAVVLGLLMAAIGGGALVGALFVASLPRRARRGRLLTAGNLLFPFFLLLFSASRSFPLSLLVLLGVGVSFVSQNALANTLLQLAAPDELRGRVMSLFSLTMLGMMRTGGMVSGFVTDHIGAPWTVGIGAAVSLAYGLFVALQFPRLRRMT